MLGEWEWEVWSSRETGATVKLHDELFNSVDGTEDGGRVGGGGGYQE